MMIINDVDQKVVCWCDFAECVFNIIFFVYRKPLLWVVGLLSSVAMCPNCAFALLHGHVCLWCHFTGSSQPLFQSLVLCMSMKECHCVFVQSCRWTTVLSLVVLMPVPLPPVLPYSPVLEVCEVSKIWNYWWDVDFLLVWLSLVSLRAFTSNMFCVSLCSLLVVLWHWLYILATDLFA